uniref:Uncharacterized protein n=1 Tax=Romanomermis culicivorax TaxID=13658 RepID=A0A915KKX7_ROMCU
MTKILSKFLKFSRLKIGATSNAHGLMQRDQERFDQIGYNFKIFDFDQTSSIFARRILSAADQMMSVEKSHQSVDQIERAHTVASVYLQWAWMTKHRCCDKMSPAKYPKHMISSQNLPVQNISSRMSPKNIPNK